MGWNEPDKGKDPWGGRKSEPPDLDEALKRIKANLKKLLMKPKLGGDGNGPFSVKSPLKNGEETGIYVPIFLGLMGFLWVLSGIFIVDPAEQAVILRFGRYVETVGPGPHWIPRFIESKVVLNVARVADYSYSAQMLTKDENLVSVAVAVQYRIGDLQEYLFNVADAEEGLRQATSSALRQVVGTTTLDQVITEGRDAWGSSVQDSLTRILASYKIGITIVNVSPQPARAPENVQDAFDDTIKAQEDEKRFKEQAGAYAARVIPIAEGNAKRISEEAKAFALQVVLKATGETAEFLQLLPQFEIAPYVLQERMYLDTMTHVLQQSTKIVVDQKSNQMFYLPLDKIMADQPLSSATQLGGKGTDIAEAQSQADGNSSLLEGRAVTRPVEPQGRMD